MKKCHRCKISKDLSGFWKKSKSKDGHCIWCKECRREYQQLAHIKLKKKIYDASPRLKAIRKKWRDSDRTQNKIIFNKFGITLDDYRVLLEIQNHRCAICGVRQSELKIKLAVDHNHTTGRYRGLLCGPCNRGIGLLSEKPETLISAFEYLKFHNEEAGKYHG